jgi:hypothetical protein
MSPLETRKRLLVLESDLNRALLSADLQELRSGARWMTDVRRWLPSFRQGLALAAPVAGVLRRRRKRGGTSRKTDKGSRWFDRLFDAFKFLGPLAVYLRRFWHSRKRQ